MSRSGREGLFVAALVVAAIAYIVGAGLQDRIEEREEDERHAAANAALDRTLGLRTDTPEDYEEPSGLWHFLGTHPWALALTAFFAVLIAGRILVFARNVERAAMASQRGARE